MKVDLNIQISLYGIIISLIGLLFVALDPVRFNLLIIPTTSIGTSMVASGLTSWLITRHFVGVDVTSIVHAVAQHSDFVRTDHTLELTFSVNADGQVRATGEHVFTLVNQRGRRATKEFAIFTDQGSGHRSGGFDSVVEPSGNVLQGDSLNAYISESNGKSYFVKSYDINHHSTATFRFNTFSLFRRTDRLIWTVQDISTGFRVRVVNNTGIRNAFTVKINHHREKDIVNRITTMPMTNGEREVMIIDFNSEVLPYQGFEIMWDLEGVE
jgi:hypothetical protein